MRAMELARRNLEEVWRDPLSLGLTVGLPILLLVVFQAFGNLDDTFAPEMLTPGIVLFGFVMVMFSSAMILSRDRETALFSRLLTAPLRANEFVAGYALPYVPVAIAQAVVLFAIGAWLGISVAGSLGLVSLVLVLMAIFYVALGMIAGAYFTIRQVPFLYMIVLLLTIFGGAWLDLEEIGGTFKTVGDLFPFSHALYAVRGIIIDGDGLAQITTDLSWVAGYTLVTAVAAVLLFRRRMIE